MDCLLCSPALCAGLSVLQFWCCVWSNAQCSICSAAAWFPQRWLPLSICSVDKLCSSLGASCVSNPTLLWCSESVTVLPTGQGRRGSLALESVPTPSLLEAIKQAGMPGFCSCLCCWLGGSTLTCEVVLTVLLVLQTCLVGHLQADGACPKEKIACCVAPCGHGGLCACPYKDVWQDWALCGSGSLIPVWY